MSGICLIHVVPGAFGIPTPVPSMPFSAPLTTGLAASVLIGGKPAAVMGSAGMNTPPHVGLHPADPFMIPTVQLGQVVGGVPTVLFEGRPAATTGSPCTLCAGAPGTLVGTAATVLVGIG